MNGEQDVLQAGIFRVDIVHIVGGDETRLVTLAQVKQGFVDPLDFLDVVLLEFQEKIVRPKDFVVPVQLAAGCLQAFLLNQTWDFR